VSNFYRAEDGERGDGREPPEARDTGRGMCSRVEFLKPRPPEGVKRPKGCVCGIWPQAKGVRTQSRRHLNAVKVETGRGQEAKRPVVIQKLHIDDGCLGGGGNVPMQTTYYIHTSNQGVDSEYNDYLDYRFGLDHSKNTDTGSFSNNRQGIFHYSLLTSYIYKDSAAEEI